MQTCIDCKMFDHEATRTEVASLVRCLEPRNREGMWAKLVKAGTATCRHFVPAAQEAGHADG